MKRLTILFLTLALLLCACGGQKTNGTDEAVPVQGIEPAPDTEPVQPTGKKTHFYPLPLPDEPPPPDPRVEFISELLDSMTLEEKVGQLFFARCPATRQVEKIREYHLGGYLLFARDFQNSAGEWLTEEEFVNKIASYQSASTVPLLIGVDEEGGTVARASRNPNLFGQKRKSPQAVYKNGGMAAILQDTFGYNSRLLLLGINVNFAPVADLSTDPDDFIYDRTIGLNADETAAYIEAVVAQMNQCRVNGELRRMGSVLKHFPGYGNNIDTHTGIAIDSRPYENFTENDFLPFAAGIKAGAGAVLVSHNIVQCMDETLPASLSAKVIDILRTELGFDGVILTDDLAMDAVKQYTKDGRAAVLALLAGNSMIVTTDFETQIAEVLAAIENGELSIELIESAVRYVLNWKYDLGLLQGE